MHKIYGFFTGVILAASICSCGEEFNRRSAPKGQKSFEVNLNVGGLGLTGDRRVEELIITGLEGKFNTYVQILKSLLTPRLRLMG